MSIKGYFLLVMMDDMIGQMVPSTHSSVGTYIGLMGLAIGILILTHNLNRGSTPRRTKLRNTCTLT